MNDQSASFDLIVVSHLRWSFVWQRPQQLLSRLAKQMRILFIEEPVAVEETKNLSATLQEVVPNLITLTPRIPASECGDTPLWLWPCQDRIARQVQQVLNTFEFEERAMWFYTPTPEFLFDVVKPEVLVYDVMDELANFHFAPPELREREARLLSQASVVFTGGASLYDAKKHFNKNTHLFASGVDAAHYASACSEETTTPEWMDGLPSPRATYIGVIDERLDYELIAHMAAARPEVQFLMCGPIVKVDPNALPKAANLHYPGQQSYADLPRILKGSDVCLMPFAQNEATRYISPTKTLEYMATNRPVVSTPIRDVERFYSDIVFLADSPQAFAEQLDAALSESTEERARKREIEERILAEHAWDAIADNMHTLIRHQWATTPSARAKQQAAYLRERTPVSPSASSASAASQRAVVGGE